MTTLDAEVAEIPQVGLYKNWYKVVLLVAIIPMTWLFSRALDFNNGQTARAALALEASNHSHPASELTNYRLVYHDEFNQARLDETKWYPYRLPHWTTPATVSGSQAKYTINNGVLTLTTEEQIAWSPWDQNNVFSTLMTGEYAGQAGSKDGLHEFGNCIQLDECVVSPQFSNLSVQLGVFRYGYFELRAKAPAGSRASWWMVGFEDDPQHSAEIDVFEYNAAKPTQWGSKCVHFGIHAWEDSNIVGESFYFGDDCTNYQTWNTYGLLWLPDHITLYVNGVPVKTIEQSPRYKMVTILDAARWSTEPHNQFEIDYFRVYQLPQIVNLSAKMLNGSPG